MCGTLWPHICLADPFLVKIYCIPLSSPVDMAKEIKTRSRSLESTLEGVEMKHPLVKAIRLARSTIISSLVYNPRLKFKSFRRSSNCRSGTSRRRENRAREPSRRGISHTKGIIPSWAIVQCHPHVIVWLVSRIFFATLSPAHDPFSLSRASSVAPPENPSTPSLPVTPWWPSRGRTCMTQDNGPTHLASLSEMWSSNEVQLLIDGERPHSYIALYAKDDLGSGL